MKQISYALGFDPSLTSKTFKTKQQKDEKNENKESLTLCNGDFKNKEASENRDDQKQTHIDIYEDVVIENQQQAETTKPDLPPLSTLSYPSGITHLILDMGHCPYVDNDGALTIKKLYNTLKKIDIRLYLAACNSKFCLPIDCDVGTVWRNTAVVE